jgi:MOSC domain-containing protein YiiM
MSDDLGLNGRIVSINISDGGVPKLAVPSARVTFDGVVGDAQNDRRHHGGPHQKLCLYSWEVIAELQNEGHPIEAGSAGENLTISGLDWSLMRTGARLAVGATLVAEVTKPTSPCAKNSQWFLERNHHRMSEELHPGWSRWYGRVLAEGDVPVGDPVEITLPT